MLFAFSALLESTRRRGMRNSISITSVVLEQSHTMYSFHEDLRSPTEERSILNTQSLLSRSSLFSCNFLFRMLFAVGTWKNVPALHQSSHSHLQPHWCILIKVSNSTGICSEVFHQPQSRVLYARRITRLCDCVRKSTRYRVDPCYENNLSCYYHCLSEWISRDCWSLGWVCIFN